MKFVIKIVVADEGTAKEFVDDTKESDSIAYESITGDSVEFGVVDISYEKVEDA